MVKKTSTSTYKPGESIANIQKKYNLKNVIKLASNENPSGPSKKAILLANQTIKDINRYPDSKSFDLKNNLQKYLSKTNIKTDNIIIGNGSNEILELISRAYLDAKSEVLFSKHSFLVYKIISNNMKAKIIESMPITKKGLGYMGVDLNVMRSKVTLKTKVVFIANPNNPTGTILTYKELESFVKSMPKRIIIVIDEAYCEYAIHKGYKSAINLIKKFSNVIITRSFSKIFALAGVRVGYGLASASIIGRLNDMRQPFNVNYVAQSMAAVSLKDTSFVRKSLLDNDKGMEFLKKEFDKLRISYLESYTNFITINLGNKANLIYKKLLINGIILRPLDNYEMKNYLRVTVGTPKENAYFITKLKSIMGLKHNV
tara:strand:- start:1585 stop:2700 length:1116 start_codon:yes stop_codon:yes gene_type:complete